MLPPTTLRILVLILTSNQHLTSYPVVHDSISGFKSHPTGQRIESLAEQGYNTFAAPVVPYFHTPISYLSPYISRVDSLGDATLSKVEETFPVIKKPTGELYNESKDLAFLPIKKAFEAKDYAWDTFVKQVKAAGGPNLVAYTKAAVTTPIILTADTISWLASAADKKKTETKEVANEKMNH